MRRAFVNGSVSLILAIVLAGFSLLPLGVVTAAEVDAKTLYQKQCAMCHGADGVAKPMWAQKGAKNFNDPAWQKGVSNESLTKSITDGIAEKKMPTYKGKLKPEEIEALVKHIRSLAPAK